MSQQNYVISSDQQEAIANHVTFLLSTVTSLLETQSFVTIGLSGGSFIKLFAAELVKRKSEFDAVKNKVKFLFCDERFVASDSPDSTYGEFVKANFFSSLDIQNENVLTIKTDAANVEECALDYEKKVKEVLNKENGFDILLLGMGPDGHTCSLFPGHDLFTNASSQTRIVLPISDSPKPPPQRVTLTLNYVRNSRNLVFFACGAGKADMIKRILVDKDESLPSTMAAPKSATGVLKWFVDKDAAKYLA